MTHRFELLRLRIAAPGVVRVCGFYGTRCAGAHADQYLFAASYFCTHTHTVKYMLRATFNDRQRGPAGVSSSVEMMSAFHVIRHISISLPARVVDQRIYISVLLVRFLLLLPIVVVTEPPGAMKPSRSREIATAKLFKHRHLAPTGHGHR